MAEGDPEVDNSFYEQNAQCWRCRMYVPRVEMKYHAGMLYCPICYQDVAEAGGRCQLCGSQLEPGEQQFCHQCIEKKKQKERSKCPRCGSAMEGGICPRCSRGEPGEGGHCPRCGSRLEGGVCSRCARGEPPEPPKRCPSCGAQLDGWVCPKCSWEPDRKPFGASTGVVGCSNCHGPANPPAWRGGQPYCQVCAEKQGISTPIRVATRIRGLFRELVKPKTRERVRVKAKEEKSNEEQKGKNE